MADYTTVFISATTRDLAKYRAKADDTLRKKDGIHTLTQDHFGPDFDQLVRSLERKITASDAIVCLVGFVYGEEPPARPAGEPRRSYTQLEFDIARRLQKPIAIFFADESLDAGTDQPPGCRELQLKYRKELQSLGLRWETFKSEEELATLVALPDYRGPFGSQGRNIRSATRARAVSTEVRPITSLTELRQVYDIDNYETRENISFELFREWYQAYLPGFLGAFERKSPIGVIGLFPVTPEWVEALKRHELTEHDLHKPVIEAGNQQRTDWYLSGISLREKKTGRPQTGGWRCAKLISQCFQRLYKQNHAMIRKYGIRVVSAAATDMGERLLAHYGFDPVRSKDEERRLDAIFERRMDESHFDILFLKDPVCSAVCNPILLEEYKALAAKSVS